MKTALLITTLLAAASIRSKSLDELKANAGVEGLDWLYPIVDVETSNSECLEQTREKIRENFGFRISGNTLEALLLNFAFGKSPESLGLELLEERDFEALVEALVENAQSLSQIEQELRSAVPSLAISTSAEYRPGKAASALAKTEIELRRFVLRKNPGIGEAEVEAQVRPVVERLIAAYDKISVDFRKLESNRFMIHVQFQKYFRALVAFSDRCVNTCKPRELIERIRCLFQAYTSSIKLVDVPSSYIRKVACELSFAKDVAGAIDLQENRLANDIVRMMQNIESGESNLLGDIHDRIQL